MFVSYDSDGAEVIRNLASVGIRLEEHVRSGLLRIVSARTINGSAETYLVRIKSLAAEHGARCLVVDPVSSLSKSGNALTANGVVERLIHWAKAEGMTLICTSLLDEMASQSDGASTLRVSTLADTWIHLNYLVQAGERNRGMSIIKSRGTAHSNQVRELILSERGVTLTDTYSAGGEVLMGTLRWEKERAERVGNAALDRAAKLKEVQLDAEQAELEVRMKALQVELMSKQAEKALLTQATESRALEYLQGRSQVQEMRGADEAMPRPA
jgi:circadian clock protein KaiC